MVALTCHPNTQEDEAKDCLQFKASLDCETLAQKDKNELVVGGAHL